MSNIKPITCILFTGVFSLSTSLVKAEIPKTPEFKDYANLLERSPFKIKTIKKVEKVVAPEPKPEPKPKPSNDYELRGVTKLQDKWMVVMVDKKEPTKNIIIKQGAKHGSNMELIDVSQNIDDYELTSATLKVADQVITINYNKESLKANYTADKGRSSDRRGGDWRGGDRGGDRNSDRDKERRERYEQIMKYMKAKREEAEKRSR